MKRHMLEKGVISLCGVQGCCPTIDFTDPQKIVFRDDFGGKVQLTQAQWQLYTESLLRRVVMKNSLIVLE